MEHSQLSTALEIFVEVWFSFFLFGNVRSLWMVFRHFLEEIQKPGSTFQPPLWEKMHSDNYLTRAYQWFGQVVILADKWQPTVNTSFLDALKGKDFCCILLSDRCPCGLGPRRQWNGVSESREICGSARQWDSNKIWSFYETSEAESIYTVCAGSWQCPRGFNKVAASIYQRKTILFQYLSVRFFKSCTILDTQCFL